MIDPAALASTSQPARQAGATASLSAIDVVQAPDPSTSFNAVSESPCMKKIDPPPAAGALVNAAGTIHCCVPDTRS